MATGTKSTDDAPVTETAAPKRYVVLTGLLVAKVDKEGKRVERFVRGKVFTPMVEHHDVEDMVARGLIASEDDVRAGKARVLTALELSKRAAQISGETSPVLDLAVQPRAVPDDGQPDEPTASEDAAASTAAPTA